VAVKLQNFRKSGSKEEFLKPEKFILQWYLKGGRIFVFNFSATLAGKRYKNLATVKG
jgi:hypothetical protein